MDNFFTRNKNNLDKTIKIVSYLLIIYIIFLLGKSLWTNYSLKSSIEKLNTQIASLEQQKKELENLNLYYKTDSFKELEARKKLGMKRPDENVLIISEQTQNQNFSQEIESEKENLIGESEGENMTNYQLWWKYFFSSP